MLDPPILFYSDRSNTIHLICSDGKQSANTVNEGVDVYPMNCMHILPRRSLHRTTQRGPLALRNTTQNKTIPSSCCSNPNTAAKCIHIHCCQVHNTVFSPTPIILLSVFRNQDEERCCKKRHSLCSYKSQ